MHAEYVNTASGIVRPHSGHQLLAAPAFKPAIQADRNTATPLSALLPGPTQVILSSAALGWNGILVEKHLSSPGQRGPITIEWHVISSLSAYSASFEFDSSRDDSSWQVVRPGMMTVMPAGRVPAVRTRTSVEVVHCALEETFTRDIAGQMDREPKLQRTFQAALRDASIQRILGLLVEEIETQGRLGKLYVDSLAHALATRFLLLGPVADVQREGAACVLPKRILRRVCERIEANLHTDLSLDALALESGYSRAHFLRMFRGAMGLTPHQYVLECRLRHAKECLRSKNTNIIDVAAICGFASQSHMTSVFRKHLARTPAEYRRNS